MIKLAFKNRSNSYQELPGIAAGQDLFTDDEAYLLER